MDNAQKAIMIGVGLFITIIIIAAVMLITGMGQDMINNSSTQVANISSSLQAQLTSSYDDTQVTGAQVITAIKRYYTDETMVLVVAKKNGSNYTYTNYGKITYNDATINVSGSNVAVTATKSSGYTPTAVGKLSDTSSTGTYVSSTAKYQAKLIKISDTVVGLCFVEK